MRKVLYIVTALIIVAGSGFIAVAMLWRSSPEYSFSRVAFGFEAGGNGMRLMRWEGPIRFQLLHSDDNNISRLALRRGVEVARIINRSAETVDRGGNYFISVINDPLYAGVEKLHQSIRMFAPDKEAWVRRYVEELRTMEASSFFIVLFNVPSGQVSLRGEDYSIYRALVVIDANTPEDLVRAHVTQEVAQAFGATNDLPRSSGIESVFRDSGPASELTEHDRWILSTLYRTELRPGMTKNQVMNILRTLRE